MIGDKGLGHLYSSVKCGLKEERLGSFTRGEGEGP